MGRKAMSAKAEGERDWPVGGKERTIGRLEIGEDERGGNGGARRFARFGKNSGSGAAREKESEARASFLFSNFFAIRGAEVSPKRVGAREEGPVILGEGDFSPRSALANVWVGEPVARKRAWGI
jgi:hypothetical protein